MTTPNPRDAALARVHARHERVRDARIAVEALANVVGRRHPGVPPLLAAARDLADDARTAASTVAYTDTGTAAEVDALADRIGEAADALDALLREMTPRLLPRPRDTAILAAREAYWRHARSVPVDPQLDAMRRTAETPLSPLGPGLLDAPLPPYPGSARDGWAAIRERLATMPGPTVPRGGITYGNTPDGPAVTSERVAPLDPAMLPDLDGATDDQVRDALAALADETVTDAPDTPPETPHD